MKQLQKIIAWAGFVAGLLCGSSACAQTAAPAPLEPIYWRQNLLTVPYQWSTSAEAPGPKAVWLYVSRDRGASWKLVADGDSRLLSFNYRAEADGEYWFAVRTTENRNFRAPTTLPSSVGLQPELKVIVDTTAPRVESLTAQTIVPNTLEIRWRVSDANLGAQSCTVEAQLAPAGEWQSVPLRGASQTSPGLWEGTASLVLSEGSTPTAVRASVADLADNRARAQTVIGGDGGVPATTVAAATPFGSGWISNSAGPIASNPHAAPAEPQLWPADRHGRGQAVEPMGGAAAVVYGTPIGVGAPSDAPPVSTRELSIPDAAEDVRLRWRAAADREAPVERPDVLRTASLSRTGVASNASHPAKSFQTLPPPMNPLARRVNTRSFALEYELADVGDEGVAKVEAWCTHDGGQTWQRYAVDDDNRSPIPVTVDGAGEYGFTIVVSGTSAEPSAPPQAGDSPGLWVEVDLEPPTARILEVNAARGQIGGELTVTWEADDEHLEPRPIALFYSSRSTGPWTPIATSIENLGEFTWPIERHVPRRVYLKLEAHDAAGNVAAFQTADPVITESQPVVATWQRLPAVE